MITCTTTDGTNISTSLEYTVYDYPVREESIFLAHRGDMESAPENTLPAFQSAIDRGYKYIEFDVQQSSVSNAASQVPTDPEAPDYDPNYIEEPEDPFLIIMHDTTLKRMTGKKGYVHQLTRENINSYPVKKGKNIKKYGKKLKIPTLEETLDVIFSADHEVVPCIHIKEPSAGHPGLTRAGIQKILDLCKGHEIKILCRNIDDLKTITELSGPDDNIELWVSSLTLGYPDVVDLIRVCEENDLDIKGLTFSQTNLLAHPEFIEQAHARGYMVDVYGIANTYQYLKFKKMGVDRMTCNVKVFKDAE